MKNGILGAAVLAVVAAVGFFLMASRDGPAWKAAQQADNVAAYEAFLHDYPDSKYADAANKAVAVFREAAQWSALERDPNIEAMYAFVKAFPQGEHIDEALSTLKSSLFHSSIEQLRGRPEGLPGREIDEIETIAAAAEKERPENANDYRLAIDVLGAFLRNPEAEPFRTSFPEIQPESDGETPRLGAYAMATGFSMSGTITGAHSNLHLKGMVLPPGGQLGNAVTLAEGTTVFFSPGTRRRNFAGNIAVSASNEDPNSDASKLPGAYYAFTELPDEWVFYKTAGFGMASSDDTGILIPNGHGTVIRFKGEIEGFFEGYNIHGDHDYPLAFILLEETGLTYVNGKGELVDPNGRSWQFDGHSVSVQEG